MANTIGWGSGAANNSIGWGQGKTNNAINWGGIYDLSPSGETDLVGVLTPFTVDTNRVKVDSTNITSDKTI